MVSSSGDTSTATNVYGADTTKVALITGGGMISSSRVPTPKVERRRVLTYAASGMGLEVARALSKRGGWQINLLDLNAERGEEAASSLGETAKFHQTDVGQYKALSTTFDSIFKSQGRLDFVFANAGVVERDSFYAHHPSDAGPPPPPDLLSVDINLKAVITTSYLAQHYFRLSPEKGKGANLVATASCGGFYPVPFGPMYSGAKHGVVGFMRSIARNFWKNDGIRVNMICPGSVRTNLLESSAWDMFKPEWFVPIEKIAEVVLMLVDGYDETEGQIRDASKEPFWGKAVEISGTRHYFRDRQEYCDKYMRDCMESMNGMENV
ncbi:hypothetical protein LTR04_005522 [Oleoguttula sp. CCFEE 6159]|nr:hypothetical protein LTR04_005522 [Oleoguttula sp. CCFEE 6159]